VQFIAPFSFIEDEEYPVREELTMNDHYGGEISGIIKSMGLVLVTSVQAPFTPSPLSFS